MSSDLKSRFPGALRVCAEDAGVPETKTGFVEKPVHNIHLSSEVRLIAIDGEDRRYVLKTSSPPWCPQHERNAIDRICDLLAEGDEPDCASVQAIHHDKEHAYLVMRYQSGTSLQPCFEDEIRRGSGQTQAQTYCRQIAKWLSLLWPGATARPDQDTYLTALETRLVELSRVAAEKRVVTPQYATAIPRYIEQLDRADFERLALALPHRGDSRPKNFLAQNGILYGLDYEGFGTEGIEVDAVAMRDYLVFDSLGRLGARKRALSLWKAFEGEYVLRGGALNLVFLGYLLHLLSWHCSDRARPVGTIKKQLRTKVLAWDRVRWMRRMSGDLSRDVAIFSEFL